MSQPGTLLSALILLGSAPVGQEPNAPDLIELERAVAALVSDTVQRDTVRSLVKLGPRMGGTPSGVAASAWLATRFSELGLSTTVTEDEPRWCHTEESWSVVAHIEGRDEPIELGSAWPYGFSPAGRGRAQLSTTPLADCALLSTRQSRPRRGEAEPALVLVDGVVTLDGAYPRVRHLRAGDGNPFPVFGLGSTDGELLRAALARDLEVEIEFALEATIERARPRTVIASLPARDGAPPGHLLFCAHGDSDAGGPGANDNASGEAVVLEIARAWASAVREGILPAPPREVRFAVWGSEIHSTRGYLERWAEDEDPVLAVINYDQAGFGSGAEQLNVEPDDLEANEGLVRTALAVLADHGGQAGFPQQWASNKSLGGTDSYVFSGSATFRKQLRPAVTLFTSAWDSPADHPRTPGMPGESWRERDQVRVDYDVATHRRTPPTSSRTTWVGVRGWGC